MKLCTWPHKGWPFRMQSTEPDELSNTGDYMPELGEESALLSDQDIRALVLALPLRHRWRRWNLMYSTARDGISLQTLYRLSTPFLLC